MRRFSPNERIQIYTPLHKLVGLISKEHEEEIEDEKYDDIILDSPTSRNQKKIIRRLPDPVERLAILALTAKRMADKETTDDRNILFSLSRIPYFLFPNFNEDNIILYSQAELEEVNDALKLVEGLTEDSLIQIQEDIKYFLEDKKPEEEKKKEDKGTNPFFALLGIGKKKEVKKEEKKKIEKIAPDNYYEKVLRELAQNESKKACFTIFDIYKKAHGMPSHPSLY